MGALPPCTPLVFSVFFGQPSFPSLHNIVMTTKASETVYLTNPQASAMHHIAIYSEGNFSRLENSECKTNMRVPLAFLMRF